MQLITALSQLLLSVGLLVCFFAVYPPKQGPGITLDHAADFSTIKLEIAAARPSMLRLGALLFGIGLLGVGIVGVLAALGLVHS
jgi:hypothetical protein